jgi:hypothetical protein
MVSASSAEAVEEAISGYQVDLLNGP